MKKVNSFSQVSIQSIAVMISAGITLSACGNGLLTEVRSEQGPGSQVAGEASQTVAGEAPEANESNPGDQEPAAEIAEETEASTDITVITAENSPTPSPSPTETVVAADQQDSGTLPVVEPATLTPFPAPEGVSVTLKHIPDGSVLKGGFSIPFTYEISGKIPEEFFKKSPPSSTISTFLFGQIEIENLNDRSITYQRKNFTDPVLSTPDLRTAEISWSNPENYSTVEHIRLPLAEAFPNGLYRVSFRLVNSYARQTEVLAQHTIELRNETRTNSIQAFGSFEGTLKTEIFRDVIESPIYINSFWLYANNGYIKGLRSRATTTLAGRYVDPLISHESNWGLLHGNQDLPVSSAKDPACPQGYAVDGVVIHHSEPRGPATGMALRCKNINNPSDRIKLKPALTGISNHQTEVFCEDHLFAVGSTTSFAKDQLHGYVLHCQ